MQGLGNDYIYLNCLSSFPENPEKLARIISDRHFGVGSDGLVLICPSDEADFQMRMFNADGSEAEMCGNAARCVGKYVYEKGLTAKESFLLKTGAGIREIRLTAENGTVKKVCVDMGKPETDPARIPVLADPEHVLSLPVPMKTGVMYGTCVSMGNPHAVFFVENADSFPVEEIGPEIENHPLFPARVNAEFVTILKKNHLRMRVWERGSGETMACGTGACATLVAGVLTGKCESETVISLNGGDLKVKWDQNTESVLQEGPAEFVFEGEYPFTLQEEG